jgi:UDPglucose 6-dehydrogenase
MRVTIFGTGYVGLVTGACLAEIGHHVVCVDVNRTRIERLNRGEIPIYEPGLDALMERNLAKGTLEFTCHAAQAVTHAEVQFVAVGTPPNDDGAADLRYVLSVAETIGREMDRFKVVVVKSTVPVGTCDKVHERIAAILAERGSAIDFDVVSNPEFLKEGAAVGDFLKPDRIVIGATSDPWVPATTSCA